MKLEAFKKQVLPCKDKLFRFALKLLKSEEEAEDVVQDTLVKLWTKRKELQRIKSLEAFAMTMIRNQCIDILKAKRRNTVEWEKAGVEFQEEQTPYKQTHIHETVSQVHRLIDGLPELQKAVIHLRDVEGYEMSEIAGIMKMNNNAVRVNLSRARQKIKDALLKAERYEYK